MDFSHLPNDKSRRFIAILNKKIETGKLMNALGHMSAGLAGGYNSSNDMCFLLYKDNDGGNHPNISQFPFIILKADNSNQIRNVRNELINLKIPFTDFTSTMTVGTSEEQVIATANTKEADLEYYGICMFGNTEELKSITKKFSIFS